MKHPLLVLLGPAALVGACFLVHDYEIRSRIEAKTAFYNQGMIRLSEVMDRMERMSSWPGSDLKPFQEILASESKNLLRLDREREDLRAGLWILPGRL